MMHLLSYCNYFVDHQKLEREARICRALKHPNIGKKLDDNSYLEKVTVNVDA
jgi:hypothetical protein